MPDSITSLLLKCHFVIHFVMCEKMMWSQCLGLVKHFYSIQAIILISLIRLQGVTKICISFADKYINVYMYLVFDIKKVKN